MALTAALGVMAGLFALLGGDFLAAGQLLVYIGGVMVLLIFVVMFVQTPDLFRARQTSRRWSPALALGGGVAAVFINRFRQVPTPAQALPALTPTSAAGLGRLLAGRYGRSFRSGVADPSSGANRRTRFWFGA